MEIRALTIRDKKRYYEFNKLVHGEEGLKEELDKLLYKNPFCNISEDCFYVEDKGEIVSSILVTKRYQRVGRGWTKVGEFDLVGTHPDHREKGLSKKLMEYAFQKMKNEGMYLCRLIGIPHFYEKFQFEYSVPAYFYSYVDIDMDKISEAKSIFSVEKMGEFSDHILSQMIELYHEETVENFASEQRSVEYLRYMIREKGCREDSTWYVVISKGQLMGYAWIREDDQEITIKEVMVKNEEVAESLCGEIHERFKEKKVRRIGVRAPLNNRFSSYLYKLGGSFKCTNEVFKGTWGEKFKILDLKKALSGISGLLDERLKSSFFKMSTGKYKIITENDSATICIEDNKIRICDDAGETVGITMRDFTAVYTGYRSMSYYRDRVKYESEETRKIFEVLFPQGHPYIWTLDINDSLNE